MQDMAVAGLALELHRNAIGLVALAAPGAVLLGRAVRAGSAVDVLGGLGLVAELVRIAELALVLIGGGMRSDVAR
jgi:hypothetical protein